MSDVRAGNRERQARLHQRRKEQGMEQFQVWLPAPVAQMVRDRAKFDETTVADQIVTLVVRGLGVLHRGSLDGDGYDGYPEPQAKR